MAQQVKVMGAIYSDVPSLLLPDENDVMHHFDDTSVTTATAADVAEGKVFIASDGTITTGTASGGGTITVVDTPDGHGGTIREITATNVTTLVEKTITENGTYDPSNDNADGYSSVTVNVGGSPTPVERSDVNFYDFDGTLLYAYTAAEASELAEMPSNPSHTGLTAQGWNYTLAQMKTEVTAQGACDIGQMYVTDDGKSRLYCHFDDWALSLYFGVSVNGTCVVDWGDDSATDTLTDTDEYQYGAVFANHTYASAGDYIVTLTATNGSYAFTHGSFHKQAQAASSNITEDRVYSSVVQKVEVGTNAGLGSYSFQWSVNLKSITIPNSVSRISDNALNRCQNLRHLTIPSSVTERYGSNEYCISLKSISIPCTLPIWYTIRYCYSLERIVIPSSVTQLGSYDFAEDYSLQEIFISENVGSMGNYCFQNCYSLKRINFPEGMSSVPSYAFDGCSSLLFITLPSNVSTIANYAFRYCYGLKEMHLLKADSPVTIGGSNALYGIPTDCIFYVPKTEDHTLLNAYKSATYWSGRANYIQEEL